MPAESHVLSAFERLLHLKRYPLFIGLPPADLALVAEYGRERFFPKGAVLLREGEPVASVYIVVDGEVSIRRAGRVIGRAARGAGVGGLGFLARETDGAEAVAEANTLALEWDADAMLELFEDHFSILHHMLRSVCRDLVHLQIKSGCEWMPQDAARPSSLPLDRPLDLVERIFFLRRSAPFLHGSINALAELSRAVVEMRFDPGTHLWDEGDTGPSVQLIMEGTVRCRASTGCEFTAGAGFPLGVVEAMAELPRWHDAVTETRLVTLQGNVEAMLDVFEDNFDMAMDYLAAMAKALSLISQRVTGTYQTSLGAFYYGYGGQTEPTPAVP
ncbi:MAG TPA: cyclic nucleotide-binding domain-containing protein [Vicinamibacteria bacterium]